jgi:hypothetical protein
MILIRKLRTLRALLKNLRLLPRMYESLNKIESVITPASPPPPGRNNRNCQSTTWLQLLVSTGHRWSCIGPRNTNVLFFELY